MALKLVHGWRSLEQADRGGALALGNFDGVHRGHRQVIAEAARAARQLGAPLAVATFEPHPRRWFQPDAEPFRLQTLNQQARTLESLGVDRLHVLPFDAELAEMSDETFARRVLHEGLDVRHVAVGFDVTFGKGRTGDPSSLAAYGASLGFTVSTTPLIASPDGVKLSSSAVRDALASGKPEQAERILGRPFAIEGVVQHGDKRGRLLGFPTANILLDDYVRPAFGVYAVRSLLADGRRVPGVANLGRRPTVDGTEERLEVWLFDLNEDLYGQTIETDLLAFIRPERRFSGLDELKAQIAADADAARALLLPELN